jgi:hypothetical protein
MRVSNYPAAGKAEIALLFAFVHRRLGLPESGRSATITKVALTTIAVLAAVFASTAHTEPEALTTATSVSVMDQLATNQPSRPITITDSNTIAALAKAIQTAPGKWKKGSFTAPAGYLRFAFFCDSHALADIGLADRCLVRGGGGHWEFKAISRDLEVRIAALGRPKPPNPEHGANGKQSLGSVTNRTPLAAASGRPL